MVRLAEKALADSCGLFFPKLKLIKRLVAAVRALFLSSTYKCNFLGADNKQ